MDGVKFFVIQGFYHADIITSHIINVNPYCIDHLVWAEKDLIYTNQLFWVTNKRIICSRYFINGE